MDFYYHEGPGGKPAGVNGDEKMMGTTYQSIPDLHLTIEDMITEADRLMCRTLGVVFPSWTNAVQPRQLSWSEQTQHS